VPEVSAELDITPDRYQDQGVSAGQKFIARPPVEGPSALPNSFGIDMLNRLVRLAQESIRRPDVSVVYQGVPGAEGVPPEKTTCMAENKLKNMQAAVD
jgi:hypothetical protein